MDFKDPFFSDRGVDPDVAAVRGYTFWDEDTYREVVADTFGHLSRAINGWASYVTRQGEGVTIPRFPAEGYDPVTPGLRPSDPVKLGPPKRHFHPDDEPTEFTDVLPNAVHEAYASPQRGRVKIYFTHTHGTQEEHAEHVAQFHNNGNVTADPHGHTYFVVKLSHMRKHVAQTKNVDSHMGENPQTVHAHQKRAKYLYTPSAKHEAPWPTSHTHDDMTPAQLTRHLEFFPHEPN